MDNYLVHFEEGNVLRFALTSCCYPMPCGNQISQCVFVFDVPCFDEVNQRNESFGWQKQLPLPVLFSQTQMQKLFLSHFLSLHLFYLLSPVSSIYKRQNSPWWQPTHLCKELCDLSFFTMCMLLFSLINLMESKWQPP